MRYHILVTLPTSARQRELIEAAAPEAEFEYCRRSAATEQTIQNADIIIGNVSPNKIRASERLLFLQLYSAGADEYIAPGVLFPKTKLASATGAFGPAISEHMLGVLLMLLKRFNEYYENQKARVWRSQDEVKCIDGSTALILGLGDIGGEFARKIHALGAYTIGVRRTRREKPEYIDELSSMDELEKALPRADIIALCLPETSSTRSLFDAKLFSYCKPGATLLNVGRGSAVDTEALVSALDSGRIGGAALDVTDPEPLPPEHALWGMKNVLITPHISAGFQLERTRDRIAARAAENLRRFLSGRALECEVDFETGYRKMPDE
ncbi:MAG: D-2-hydroxyacid dehydrogenase [Bacillota bacterium]